MRKLALASLAAFTLTAACADEAILPLAPDAAVFSSVGNRGGNVPPPFACSRLPVSVRLNPAIKCNNAPVVEILEITPNGPGTDDVLTVTATVSDADGDDVTLTYVWKINGDIVQETENTADLTDTLDLVAFTVAAGDVITVEVTPHDGVTAGTTVIAQVNWAPIAAAIDDQFFSGSGDWVFDVSGSFSDPDGDELTFTATLEDGSALPGWLNFTASGVFEGNPSVHDAGTLSIQVTATDPSGLSTSTTFELTLANTPDSLNDAPQVTSLELTPQGPNVDDVLTATVDVVDLDGNPVTLTYIWRINGESVQTTPGTSSLTDTLDLGEFAVVAGDVITVEVTPNDGFTAGTTVIAQVNW